MRLATSGFAMDSKVAELFQCRNAVTRPSSDSHTAQGELTAQRPNGDVAD